MFLYRIGSSGPEVVRIQERLQALHLYRGPIDGLFGGGTDAAVRAFQQSRRLQVDGIVGPRTWQRLFSETIPEPELLHESLDTRCLALTGTFETGQGPPECFAGLSGDFDGQGLSLGVLQWNFGQDSLQPLLKTMLRQHRAVARAAFQENLPVLNAALAGPKDALMDWVRSIQDPRRHRIREPWRGQFKSLCRTPEFQAIQAGAAAKLLAQSRRLCSRYGLWSERAVALMFDIKVQNGSIQRVVQAQILAEFAQLPSALEGEEEEVERMLIVANRRAEAANPRWVEDVRARKLCIARGEGVVHGVRYQLAEQFGIGLRRAVGRDR